MHQIPVTGVERKAQTVKIPKCLLILSLFAMFMAQAQAAIITVGDHDIAPNTTTEIQILIQREGSDSDLFGASLALQVTEGTTLAGPAIDSVDLITGTLFATHDVAVEEIISGSDPPQHAFWEVLTNDLSPIAIPQDGLLATVRIDATGFTEGMTYNLTASSFIANGGAIGTLLIDTNGEEVTPTVIDGTITITPEPAAFTLWAVSGLLAMSLRRHKRQ